MADSSSSSPAPAPRPPAIRPMPPRSGVGALAAGSRSGATPIPPSLQAKMAAMANRGAPPAPPGAATRAAPSLAPPGVPSPARGPPGGGMAGRRRPNFRLEQITGETPASAGPSGANLGAGRPAFADEPPRRAAASVTATPFASLSKIVDPSGALRFRQAVLTSSGVDFSNGQSFAINMNQLEMQEDLGKGNYGAVKRVLHKPTNVVMAMKEIRLELDDSKLKGIIMELDILHRAVAPEIVDFYGAFFVESCVYYCMEYMDAGSMDKLQAAGVPEPVLGRIVKSMVKGLKFLKDELQIMHRDVKPTNVVLTRKGEVKLCDFGVSGQLEKSLAKTNIGCQSYMAPERIKGESTGAVATYTVSSDVWSLGLTAIEMGVGHYPYPPETYANVFAQLTAIVHGAPPELPEASYSAGARQFVTRCLEKVPERRPTYAELLEEPFMVDDESREVDMVAWVESAIAAREAQKTAAAESEA